VHTRGLISGVPSGAFGLTKGGGAGNFPATASASHSSMVLPDGALTAAAASCSLLTLMAVERSLGPALGTAEQLPKAAWPWALLAWSSSQLLRHCLNTNKLPLFKTKHKFIKFPEVQTDSFEAKDSYRNN